MKETIDKRTLHGKQLIHKIQTVTDAQLQKASIDTGIHPALTMLRYRDVSMFKIIPNLN